MSLRIGLCGPKLVVTRVLRYQPAIPQCGTSAVEIPFKSACPPSAGTAAEFSRESRMKSDIHPNYHTIKVVMTDGTEYVTRSTWGREGDTLNLDIDPKTHPAWTGGSQQLLDRGGRLSRFNSRFGAIGLGKK
jgi:large subunit ribosomal protein L31